MAVSRAAGLLRRTIRAWRPWAYVRICMLALTSGAAYLLFAARYPGQSITLRLLLAVVLVVYNGIRDCVIHRERRLGEIWSAAHPADALDRARADAGSGLSDKVSDNEHGWQETMADASGRESPGQHRISDRR
jgi:hypothetical protein